VIFQKNNLLIYVISSSITQNEFEFYSDFEFNKYFLSKEIQIYLDKLEESENNFKKNSLLTKKIESNIDIFYNIEINFIRLMISIYTNSNSKQNIFVNFYDPKYYVKIIKEKDSYMGYLAYALYHTIIKPDFNPENIMLEIIEYYPKRIETLFFYWNFLTKSKLKDFDKALVLSEIFLRNLPHYEYENELY
jgi:hypothetical protein